MSGTLQLGDPFSAAAGDQTQPGALGQSPAFWQHLAMFGGNLAAAANARTGSGHLAYGSGFAGPFGAAIGETAQQAQQQAMSNANIGRSRAETTGLGLQNELAASSLPLAKAKNAFMQMLYQNPDAMNQFMQNGTYPQMGGGAPGVSNGVLNQGGGVGGGPLAPAVAQLESGGRTNTPGIIGDGGKAAGPMQVHQAALQDVNQKYGTNFTLDQLSSNPHLGTQVGNAYLQMQQNRYPGRPDLALASYNAGPGATQKAVQSGQGVSGLPASTQNYVQKGMGYDPSQGLAQANQFEQRANVAERMKALGLPVGEDPQALRQAAQAYRQSGLAAPTKGAEAAAQAGVELATAGQIQREKSANSNVDIRPGGMVRAVNPQTGQSEWIKNPQLEKIQTPSGETQYAHIAPALPGSPPGTPGSIDPVLGANGQPAVQAIPPNVQHARNKAYEDFTGKDTDSYLAAQNTHSWLEQMNHAAETLNQSGGFLQTGPTAPERLKFANGVNDVLRTMGVGAAFDPQKVAAWEELKKATTTAGFELSSHYEGHARQAAQTIINATSAVPSVENSPVGFQMVSAGIQEAAQSAIDLHEYKQQLYNTGGDLTRGEVDFYQQHPAQQYARRAISTVNPYPIKSPNEMSRYLPGTYVTLPNGKLTQVPARDTAPGVPEYLRGATPGQAPQ